MLAAPVLVRGVEPGDAAELAELLNAIIARGGTTALEDPCDAAGLARSYLTGPDVHCCVVAQDNASGKLEGFQTLGRYANLPGDIGDIGTFARVDGAQRGVGTAMFASTVVRARDLGLAAINATIRADNGDGLAFYERLGFVPHSITAPLPLRDGACVARVSKRFDLAARAGH